jgi:hypothetical protein
MQNTDNVSKICCNSGWKERLVMKTAAEYRAMELFQMGARPGISN